MDGITSFVSRIVDTVNTFLWDYALLFLLVEPASFYPYAAVYPGAEIRGGNEILFGNFSLHGKGTEKGLSSFQP